MPGSPSASRTPRPTLDPLAGPVRVNHDGVVVTISLHGLLDGRAGEALIDSMRHELDRGPSRIAIDLLSVDGWTEEGAIALRQCKELATNVPGGLHYRTDAGAGSEALLVACADDDGEAAEFA